MAKQFLISVSLSAAARSTRGPFEAHGGVLATPIVAYGIWGFVDRQYVFLWCDSSRRDLTVVASANLGPQNIVSFSIERQWSARLTDNYNRREG